MKDLRKDLNLYQVYLPQEQIDVIEKHPEWTTWLDSQGFIFFDTKDTITLHQDIEMAYHLLQDPEFRIKYLPTIKKKLKYDVKTRLFILSYIAQHKLYDQLNLCDLLQGSLDVQHYRLWRFFFSMLCETKKWPDLIRTSMFCIDFTFYFSNHHQQNLVLSVILDFLFFIKANKFDINTIFQFLVEHQKTLFESPEKTLLLFSELQNYLFEKRQETNFQLNANKHLQEWLNNWEKIPTKKTIRVLLARFKVHTKMLGSCMKLISENYVNVEEIIKWLYEPQSKNF